MENFRQVMFFTRRFLVQGVYQNVCKFNSDLLSELLFQHGESQTNLEIDKDFLKFMVEKILQNWENAQKVVDFYKKDGFEFSRCAKAVLISAFCELNLKRNPVNIVIDDYMDSAKMFCETEAKAINKILDSFVKNCDCDFENLRKEPAKKLTNSENSSQKMDENSEKNPQNSAEISEKKTENQFENPGKIEEKILIENPTEIQDEKI